MFKKIDFTPLLNDIGEADALTYLIKLYLKEVEGIPVKINPLHPEEEIIEVENGILEYRFILGDKFEFEYEYV